MTKRYLVFAGDFYYPGGGWDDFKGAHDTLESAQGAAKTAGGDWCHIVDTETMAVALESVGDGAVSHLEPPK